jgi:transposase
MGHIQGANRHDVICFPERLDNDLAEDNPVRFRDACVDALDLEASGFQRAVPAATGRPGDAPGALLKRYLDGDRYRLRSRRRLEQETHRHVEWLWRLKKLRPEHQPSADFRKHTLKPRRQVCRTVTRRCKKLDRFGAELVAIDGRKCSAVNANERHFTKDKLTKLIRQIDARVAADLKALERRDAQADQGPGGGAHAKALTAKLEARKQRQRRDEGFQAPLLSSAQEPRSLTEPESRAMQRGKGRGTAGCDNVQTAVDAKHKLMGACEVTHAPGDRDGRSPMARQAKAVLGCGGDGVAAVGDDHGHEVKAGGEAGIMPDVPRPITSAHEQRGLFRKDDCTSDSATDTDQCPAGQVLTCRFDTVELGRHLRSSATAAGTGCAIKQPCTRRKDGRRITRWVDEYLLEEMAPRVRSRPEVMKRRKALVEHPCGTMKRWWDHGDLLMRGLAKVRTALSLTVLAYNLRRVLTRIEMPRLMAALGGGGPVRRVGVWAAVEEGVFRRETWFQ